MGLRTLWDLSRFTRGNDSIEIQVIINCKTYLGVPTNLLETGTIIIIYNIGQKNQTLLFFYFTYFRNDSTFF